jgi:hypothetical protein
LTQLSENAAQKREKKGNNTVAGVFSSLSLVESQKKKESKRVAVDLDDRNGCCVLRYCGVIFGIPPPPHPPSIRFFSRFVFLVPFRSPRRIIIVIRWLVSCLASNARLIYSVNALFFSPHCWFCGFVAGTLDFTFQTLILIFFRKLLEGPVFLLDGMKYLSFLLYVLFAWVV